MKKYVIATIIAFALNSAASEMIDGPLYNLMVSKEINENLSYYETLDDLFTNSFKPKMSEALGKMWTGRCYTQQHQYLAKNGAYNFKESHQNNGSFEAASVWRKSRASNFYDNKTVSIFNNAKYFPITDLETLLSMSYFINGARHISNLKIFGEYLIEEIYVIGSSSSRMMCYYFNP